MTTHNNGCRIVELGSVLSLIRNGLSIKQSKLTDGLPITRIETISNGEVDVTRVGYAGITTAEYGQWLLASGDILLSHINSEEHLGKVALYDGLPRDLIHGMNLLNLRADPTSVLPQYLLWVLRSNLFRRQVRRVANRSVNQASVSITALSKLEIPCPPLPEQRRIADILDKADAIRRKRQEAVELSSDFLPSLFANMFGPFGNKYRTEPLNNHLTFITSGSRGWAEHYVTVGKRFIRSLDVQMNRIGTDDVVFVNPPKGAEADRTRVQNGDVLVTITGSRIGRVAYVPYKFGEAYVSQHVSIIRPASSLRPRYCSMFLSLADGGQRQIAKAQYGQTKPGLSLSNIREFQIPIPPIAEQDRFIDIWTSHEELAARLGQGSRESDGFFNSLVQRAFRGEL